MDRLTRRAEAEGIKAVYYGKNDVFLEGEPGYAEANKLAHYEDLEESGRLVVLPCAVGETVWLLQTKCKYAGENNKPWENCEQYWSNVYRKNMWGCAGRDDEGNIFRCKKEEMTTYAKQMEYSLILYAPHNVLGKNLFLTREEAEAALKGGGQDE